MEISRSANIKAVLFDVGGVLFSPPQVAIAEVERELGLPPYVLDRSLLFYACIKMGGAATN